MKKRTLAFLLICTMIIPMFLTGCGKSNGTSSGGNTSSGGSTASSGDASTAVTEDGRDANGNIVDLTAYATSLGTQWFTK
ncbi:MAG: hypothetical protein VB096_03540 [Pseudoflavonifractor sp.]|nr:hypothetical protein [Pseudoflavonifractor sp.]